MRKNSSQGQKSVKLSPKLWDYSKVKEKHNAYSTKLGWNKWEWINNLRK